MILHSGAGPNSHEHRPYRAFNATIERLTHLVRGLYRDVCENITGDHPRVYRQVAAGCTVGIIAVPKECKPAQAATRPVLGEIPFIRQVLDLAAADHRSADEHAHRAVSADRRESARRI